jgi:hypothetical protein
MTIQVNGEDECDVDDDDDDDEVATLRPAYT